MSLIESVVGILVGIGISFTANEVLLPWYGFALNTQINLELTAIFTVLSLVRSYSLRRIFNVIRQR